MDESYGLGGGEDFDYCLRAHQAEIPVKFIKNSYIIHFGGKSTDPKESSEWPQKKFIDVFHKRWGPSLTGLIFYKNYDCIVSKDHLFKAMLKNSFNEIVRELIFL